MKSIFKICLLVLLLFSAKIMQAQTPKYGHIDVQTLIQAMPEYATATQSLQEYQNALQDQYATMQNEFNTKYSDYAQNAATLSDAVRSAKEEELEEIRTRISNFSSDADTKISNKQTELITPIYTKANQAIDDVAKEQGYVYVFDAQALVFKASSSSDILPLVKTKLGIQ